MLIFLDCLLKAALYCDGKKKIDTCTSCIYMFFLEVDKWKAHSAQYVFINLLPELHWQILLECILSSIWYQKVQV